MRNEALPKNVVVVAFEGPDRYSMVGGLGVRVTELVTALGEAGVQADLIFAGDPKAPPVEERGNVRLRRWGQWISAHHPGGVYEAEAARIEDMRRSVPRVVASEIVAPAAARGEQTLVIAEDWQTASILVDIHLELLERGLRGSAQLIWNANNTYGFERIDFPALLSAAHVTAVSKYMKFELALVDAPALVIPNGIAPELLERYDADAVRALSRAFKGRRALLKVGRYSPDKRWMQAIDAVAELRAAGEPVQLVIRGGKEPYGEVVLARARERGLSIEELRLEECTPQRLADALAACASDVVVLASFLPNETLYALYGAVEAVLANSGKEPFGLVGLEVMACRGIPVCGSTGEDYARPFENAIVCDTEDPLELAAYLRRVFTDEKLRSRIRDRAQKTAKRYTWPAVFEILAAKLAYVSQTTH